MVQNNREKPDKPKPRYVWDPEKLTWVEATEKAPEQVQIEEVPSEEEASVTEGIPEEVAAEEDAVAEIAPTGVALLYQGAWFRAGGAVIDLIILAIITLIIDAALGRVIGGLPNYILLVYGLLYFVGFWAWRGQTPGKMLIGAKIVRADGTPMGIERAFLRYLVYFMPIYAALPFLSRMINGALMLALALISFLVIAFTRDKRGIHDFVAGTVVIKTRSPASRAEEAVEAPEEPTDTGEAETPE